MKTKITSKNKNVINIKINTEKKEKKKRQKRTKHSGSPKGRSSYNTGGYGVAPPIIIQPHQPMVFPQYNPPVGLINQPQESNHINNHVVHHQQPTQSYHIPTAEPISLTPFINPINTTPVPIAESLPRKWKHSVVERNNQFINDTSTHAVPIAQAIDEEAEFEKFHTPLKNPSTPNLDTLHNYYDKNADDLIVHTNPMTSVTELKRSVSAPELIDFVEKKRQDRNAMSLANYHSKADDFTVDKFNNLLEKWNNMNPTSKADGDFANKKPSRSLYAILLGKVNKAEKKKPTAQQQPAIHQPADEQLELNPVRLPVRNPKKKILVVKN